MIVKKLSRQKYMFNIDKTKMIVQKYDHSKMIKTKIVKAKMINAQMTKTNLIKAKMINEK